MDKETRIKLAVQKSGRLTDPSVDLLTRCGLKLSRGKDQLMGYGENMPLDVLFVRDDDIPDLVQEDVCDLGLVGLNVLEEKRLELAARGAPARFQALRTLDFGRCRLSLAVPLEQVYDGPQSLQGKRIATTYPHLLGRFLQQRRIEAEIVILSGAVEIAPRLGRADAVCDLVSTGSTLQANHLREVETVLREPRGTDPHAGAAVAPKRTNGSSGCCCAWRACSRSRRASTSCCMRHARRCRQSGGCCPAANRPRSFRSRVHPIGWRCMRCAARTCSGRRSRA